jgi:hypothetical protein
VQIKLLFTALSAFAANQSDVAVKSCRTMNNASPARLKSRKANANQQSLNFSNRGTTEAERGTPRHKNNHVGKWMTRK